MKNKEVKYCKYCKKPLRAYNKSGICSNCGSRSIYEMYKKGWLK